mmetsp:Transcript_63357/g.57077  ORF Transcript_63357/g.57077 Transcript_63357/m.57077 type:complete len:190 (+) Transcript_63357:80-649(+)|eukprot:CAMPEP_0201576816 /NCGR_PEP_ID=MMETSP0190_2-20130828/22829_1 /ASSEMBLY_ACC=CAM_ASM_000263 /TAXON_ID=37353 /ORGANISM="Rosalina sp." /LENGTH=189 /DNA_ID=CAMNT_0048008099 /DNA_START=80 /DNA_END=649 /DNA_ORIENTATION=+
MTSFFYFIAFSLQLIIIAFGGETKHKRKHRLIGGATNGLAMCPCDADELCAKSTNGVAICNCWTKCNYECPGGFDRIDETTEYCTNMDTRNHCSTSIICDNYGQQSGKKSNKKDSKKKDSKKDTKSSSSTTKNNTRGHNHLIGETEADQEDTGYFKLSIVGFVLWQIASIGLGMLICGCAQDFRDWIQI